MVVSARKERPNFIIGADFLAAHDCDLSLRHNLFTVGAAVLSVSQSARELVMLG